MSVHLEDVVTKGVGLNINVCGASVVNKTYREIADIPI